MPLGDLPHPHLGYVDPAGRLGQRVARAVVLFERRGDLGPLLGIAQQGHPVGEQRPEQVVAGGT